MTTPTKNPTPRERRVVRLNAGVARALEAGGHAVELAGFVVDRVDGAEVKIDPSDRRRATTIAAEILRGIA